MFNITNMYLTKENKFNELKLVESVKYFKGFPTEKTEEILKHCSLAKNLINENPEITDIEFHHNCVIIEIYFNSDKINKILVLEETKEIFKAIYNIVIDWLIEQEQFIEVNGRKLKLTEVK